MWSTCKSLQQLVTDVLGNGKDNRLLELEVALDKHKDIFLFPLKSLEKDGAHRETVKKALKEPISLPYVHQKVSLSQDFIDEVLLLSDLFDSDELLMVELLLTAESQLPSYRNISRGFLAVLLYFEGHFAVIDALRTIIQARDGRAWSPSLSGEALQIVQKFTCDLWDCGFLNNVLSTLKHFDATKEFTRLERAQALGAAKHRCDVFNLLQNIQNTLAECIMLWSCQSALNITEFRSVLDCVLLSEDLTENTVNPEQPGTTTENSVEISHSRAHLLMALLYALDPFPLFATPPEQVSELSEADLSHPLYSDRSFACAVGQLLDNEKNALEAHTDIDQSDRTAVVALLRLAWAVCLRRTVHLRHELCRRRQNQLTRSPTTSPTPGQISSRGNDNDNSVDNSYGFDEDEELQAAMAIESGALEFLRKRLLQVAGFNREVLWFCRIHSLLTDLIVHMPNRVKEIRLRDEDMLRRSGFDPSSTGSGFANFLLLIAELYDQPGSQLHARFSLEYWWPTGELAGMGLTSGAALPHGSEFLTGLRGLSTRSPSKAVGMQGRTSEADNIRQSSLFRFIRSAGDMVTTPCLFLPYIRMLHGLVGCRNAADLCFSLLKANVNNPGRGASLTSWDHFFNSFRQYLDHMRQPLPQSTSSNLNQITGQVANNQLYPHLYQSSVHPHSFKYHSSSLSMDMQARSGTTIGGHITSGATIVSRAIQPEEQMGLQGVLRLISRIARMDPVARSLFASTAHWQVIPTCVGLLSCPIPLGLKADLIHLLTALSRTATLGALIWRHITASELFPATIQRTTQSHAPCGLHTEMDEVEPRAEEYPVTRAFLVLTTVLMPQLTGLWSSSAGSLGRSIMPDAKDVPMDEGWSSQSTSMVSMITFLTNSVFLKHNMRAYKNPNERWDIAAACLVLFDGCVEQFLSRLDAAAAVVLSTSASTSQSSINRPLTDAAGAGARFDEISSSFDWASVLLSGLGKVDNEPPATQPRFRPQTSSSPSSTAALLGQLHLPPGWPYSDPGFYLATQLLSDSALFRTITGLLEVGLHKMLEFPLPNGPPVGMIHATGAGLQLITRLLAKEEILYTFVRRTIINPSFPSMRRSNTYTPSGLPGLGLNVLPTCLSRLLLSINSRTGQADLLSTILRFCVFAAELPDHCTHVMKILQLLISRIRPHSDLLAVLTADETNRRELLGTFAGLIMWTAQCHVDDLEADDDEAMFGASSGLTDIDCFASFTDEWLYGRGLTQSADLVNLTTGSAPSSHPAAHTARLCTGLPRFPPQWAFPAHEWELWAAWPKARASILAPIVRPGSATSHFFTLGKFDAMNNGNWLFASVMNSRSVPLCTSLLHTLLAALDYPAPNLAHWLLGFRFESSQTVARTTLQDAGIGDQPRTCLHAMLDLIDTAVRSDCFMGPGIANPNRFALTVHWNLALIWQILYRLSASPLSSEPLLRFLRSNHDLLAKHIQLNLISGSSEFQMGLKSEAKAPTVARLSNRALLESLSLNRINWMLRILAIEVRNAAAGNHRSYAVKLLKLFWGELLVTDDLGEFTTAQSNAVAVLHRLQLYINMNGPESFDLRTLDAWVVDELITDCELGCPLLQSESMAARKASSLIDPVIFLNRIYAKLLATRLPSGGTSSVDEMAALFTWAARERLGDRAGTVAQLPEFCTGTAANRDQFISLAQDLVQLGRWIEARNEHRLMLGTGKQAALEAWRQVTEISLGVLVSPTGSSLIHALAQSNTATMLLSMTSELNGTIGGMERSRLGGADPITSLRPRAPQLICLDVMNMLLSQLCETNQTPSTLRLLASGTCLNLASFASTQLSSASRKAGLQFDDSDQMLLDMKRSATLLIPVVRLLTVSIMRTKSSNQRMRANFYGALCFLLRFAQTLTRVTTNTTKEDTSQALRLTSAECLAAIIRAAHSGELHWSHSDTLKGGLEPMTECVPILSLLCWDLTRGHSITQMASMTVLELLVAMDRSSADFVSFLCTQGTLQHLVDTIPTDLSMVESFLLLAARLNAEEELGAGDQSNAAMETESATAATSAFHMYRTKMSLLCRAATTLVGAKRIVQSNLLQCLSGCGVFSAFTVASCYAHGVESLYVGDEMMDSVVADKMGRESSTSWNCLLQLLSSCVNEIVTDESSVLHQVVRMITLSAPSDSSTSDGNEISWSTVLLPAIRLFKSLLVTLGPAHMSIIQQTIHFLYTHSDALLNQDTSLGSALLMYLNRPNYSQDRGSVGARWLTEWVAAETSVIELFALVLRASVTLTNSDEYCSLQREVVQSRVTRHVLNLLSALIGPDTELGIPIGDFRTAHRDRLGFGQLVCETQQLYLIECLTSVCAAVFGGSVTASDSSGVLSLGLSKSSHVARSILALFGTASNDAASTLPYGESRPSVQSGIQLIVSTLSWALRRIARVEEVCLLLANLGLFKASATRTEQDETPSKPKPDSRESLLSGQMVLLLLQRGACNWDLSTENLRQAANSIFSCPTGLFNLPSESALGIDGHQREVIQLQNLISVGLALLRVQLRSLITICEQSGYVTWRLLDHCLNQPDSTEDLALTKMSRTLSPRGSSAVRSLRNDSPLPQSPFQPNGMRMPPNVTPTVAESQNAKTKRELVALREYLPRLLDADLFETMARLSKSSYLESNQRLFVQVMQHRLERLVVRPGAPTS